MFHQSCICKSDPRWSVLQQNIDRGHRIGVWWTRVGARNALAGKCVSKIWTCPVWLQLLPWIGLDTTSFQCVLHSARGWNRCWNWKRSACRIYMKLGIWTVSRLWRIQQLWFNVLWSLYNQRLGVSTFVPNTWPNCLTNLFETKARVTSLNVYILFIFFIFVCFWIGMVGFKFADLPAVFF